MRKLLPLVAALAIGGEQIACSTVDGGGPIEAKDLTSERIRKTEVGVRDSRKRIKFCEDLENMDCRFEDRPTAERLVKIELERAFDVRRDPLILEVNGETLRVDRCDAPAPGFPLVAISRGLNYCEEFRPENFVEIKDLNEAELAALYKAATGIVPQ